MQLLWSRAQARAACRCGSCLHAAIARRTTTAASRRRLKISDLFTACYSTILATAALADAKVKEDRSKEWDRMIAEAKAGILMNESVCVEGTQSQPISDSLEPISSFDSRSQTRNDLSKTRWGGNSWTVPSRAQSISLESKLRILDSQLRDVSTSPKLVAGQEVTECMSCETEPDNEWVEEYDAQLPPREPKKELHLRKQEEMVARLVDRLLAQTSMFSVESSSTIRPNDMREQMNDMAQRIETLRTGFTRLPTYYWDDIKSVQEQRAALHWSLTALCDRTTPSKPSIDLMLAKICYNLLISTAPPNTLTYNTLLRTFNRLRQPHLNEIVIDSYFYESRLKLTKTTGRLILDHYRIKGDPNGFNAISKRMGGHNKSMRIRRRHTDDFWKQDVKNWALTKKVILREAHLYQKMPRGAAIFDSLICGSLEMETVRCAIRYVRAAFREGCEVTSETLCKVIKGCLVAFDRLAGISLLRAILGWIVSYDIPTNFYSKAVRSHVYRLLSLCGISPTLGSQQILPLRLPRDALEQMLRHMSIESIAESVERFGQRILSLEYVFCNIEAEYPTGLDQARQAVALMKRADGFDRIRAKNQRVGAAEGRWTRIRSLEAMLGMHATKIKTRQVELLPLAAARLTTEQKTEYLKSIRLLEQRGLVVEPSERLALLSRFVHMQNQGEIPMVKFPLKPLPKSSKGKSKSLLATDIIVPQQTSLLVSYFPLSKLESQAASV
ncbi:hypothetical protein N431DRAFT_432481 [Stipitochalara longipes BDJ]|nr:hypothetical protein N431DRAFT_432481 [Stipitochalara longipes BDJ]